MSSSTETSIYRIDNIGVHVHRACLVRDGSEIHLKPKTFRILLHLLRERDRLVTKEEFMELFWKDTAVSDDALTQCIAELRRALGDSPRNSLYLKTVPRMGYRFVGNVELVAEPAREADAATPAALPEAAAAPGPEPPAPKLPTPELAERNRPTRRIWAVVAGSLLAASLGGAALWTGTHAGPPPPVQNKRQIAIRKFENRSGQSELDWLREGLPDMLSTTLSRSRGLEVLSREPNSGQPPQSALAITGSFSKLGNSIRVDARVIESQSGTMVAAEDFTVDRQEQLLAQIDFLAARLGARIAPRTQESDRRVLGSLMTENLAAYRYYALGLAKAEALQTKEAIALFQKAFALDPGFVMAQARIGYAYAVTDAALAEGRPYLESAYRNSSKLTDKDRRHIVAWYAIANQDYQGAIRGYSELIAEYPNESEAYLRLAVLLRGESRHEEALELLRQAASIDASDPQIYNHRSAVLSEMGRHQDAIGMANHYVTLAPNDPNAYDSLGLAFQVAGQYDNALEAYGTALRMKPDFAIASMHRAMAYGQMGRERDAERESRQHADHGASDFERRRGWGILAHLLWRRGEFEQARKAVEQGLQFHLEGVTEWAPSYLLVPSVSFARPGESAAHVGRGSRFGQRTAYLFLAEAARMKGRTDEMFTNLKQLLQVRPGWGEIEIFEDALADGYLQAGRVDEAIGEYERALRLFPGIARARFHLAQAYWQKGRTEAARAQFHEFLGLWKHADEDLPELTEARSRVR